MNRHERRAAKDQARRDALAHGDTSKGLPSDVPWWVKGLIGLPNWLRAVSFVFACIVMTSAFGPGPIIFGALGLAMAPSKGREPMTGLHLGGWLGPFYLFWMVATNRRGMMQ